MISWKSPSMGLGNLTMPILECKNLANLNDSEWESK